jgi:hypothetical protein
VHHFNEGDANVNGYPLPTPDELNDAPELAVLAVLQNALGVTWRALYALYPEVYDDWRERPRTEPVISAYRILSRMGKLETAVERYRTAVLSGLLKKSDAADDSDPLSAEAF